MKLIPETLSFPDTLENLTMKKSIMLKRTQNGTDYVMLSCLLDGKRVAGFGSKIKPLQAMVENGFLGTAGQKALASYIEEHGKETIEADMLRRAQKKMDVTL